MGKIEAINITNISEENTFYVNQAILEKGKGIVNDRYYENFKEKKCTSGKKPSEDQSKATHMQAYVGNLERNKHTHTHTRAAM